MLGAHLAQEIDRLAELLCLGMGGHIGLLVALVSRCHCEDLLVERQGFLMPIHL